jgi:glycosyl transferase family 2/F5/8 type C domain-containing protein
MGGKIAAAPMSAPAPGRAEAVAPAEPAARYEFCLVACARWEESSIQEWVEYHRSIGFSHVYLYCNDDGPAPLFRAIAAYTYGADPFVTFVHRPRPGQQAEIYLHFLKTFKHETAWYSFLDIDEFFVLKDVDNIGRFMRAYEAHVDCLYFNWVLYGHSGKVHREDTATLTSYLRRARDVDGHTKMLCRSAAIEAAAVEQGYVGGRGAFHHFLDNYKLPGVRCRDVLLDSTEGYSANFGASADPFIRREGFVPAVLGSGYIAHFQFRSEDDFLRRWRRGGFAEDEMWRAMSESGAHKAVLEPRNQVYDTYLAAYWHRYTANSMRVAVTRPEALALGENVGLNKPSWQSSVYLPDGDEPIASRSAGGGNDGVRTGGYGFHTNYEMRPWWIVDLLGWYRITVIHIYNRRDNPAVSIRANALDVLASADGASWDMLWSNPGHSVFGLDGSPLVVEAPPDRDCRFVLLRLRGADYLHLDDVGIYGAAVDRPSAAQLPEGGPAVPGYEGSAPHN